jgi:hypothetical protein
VPPNFPNQSAFQAQQRRNFYQELIDLENAGQGEEILFGEVLETKNQRLRKQREFLPGLFWQNKEPHPKSDKSEAHKSIKAKGSDKYPPENNE